MKTLIRIWVSGWTVIFCWLGFMVIVFLGMLPVKIAVWALGAQGNEILDENGFHFREFLPPLLAILLLPLAFYIAAEKTGYFDKNRVQNKSVERDADKPRPSR